MAGVWLQPDLVWTERSVDVSAPDGSNLGTGYMSDLQAVHSMLDISCSVRRGLMLCARISCTSAVFRSHVGSEQLGVKAV